MKCAEAKLLFSPYLDGAVSGTKMHALGSHLNDCSHCNREYALLRQTQELLARVGRPKVPADLALKLRLAISREAAASKNSRLEGLVIRFQNAMNAFMVECWGANGSGQVGSDAGAQTATPTAVPGL